MARQVIAPVPDSFPGSFPATESGTQIVADDIAGLSPEADGFDDLLATALANIDSEPSAIADLDSDLGLMDFIDGAFDGANITPMLSNFAGVVSAGDSLESDTAGFLGNPVVDSPSPAPPIPEPPQPVGAGGGGGGGGGEGDGGFCVTDSGEPAPIGSPLCSTF